jgi:hypothetical protein
MITLELFYKGRDKQFAADLTPEIQKNAEELLRRTNRLLELFYAANPTAHKRDCNSGWRPPAVNAGVKNAAPKSNHMKGLAVDIEDDDEMLDKWLMTAAGQKTLEICQLWMEHPSATPRWAHVQSVPPRSGRRVFNP